MKKIAQLILITMILAICSVNVCAYEVPRIVLKASDISGDPVAENYFTATGGTYVMPEQCREVAQLFSVDSKKNLSGVAVRCHSWGNHIGDLTFKLYKWDIDYATTVKSEPIQTKTFVNFTNTTMQRMDLDNADLNGDFLLVLTDPVETVGPMLADYEKGKIFVDGKEEKDSKKFELVVYTLGTPDTPESFDETPQNAYENLNMANYAEAASFYATEFNWDGVKHKGYNAKGSRGYYKYIVDFGNVSPSGAEIEIFGSFTEAKQVQLILDDYKTGDVLCTFQIMPDAKAIHEFVTAKINKSGITGVHPVYLVLENGFSISNLKFTKDVPQDNRFEKIVAQYNQTKDFTTKDSYSDTWTATDMIGRKLADHSVAGDYNPDKQVGLFYWTWHCSIGSDKNAAFNQRVIDMYPGDEAEIKNDYSYSEWRRLGYWNESIYGAYNGFDEWVLRKQLELFNAAGVDALFFDSTNDATTFTLSYMTLAKVMHQMHIEGIETPGFAFALPFLDAENNLTDLDRVYENMYAYGLYSDCWYYWDGKPVVMGLKDNLSKPTGDSGRDAQHQEMLDFFTFRAGQANYGGGQTVEDQWPWLERYPQNAYGKSEKYGCEAACVSIAQNSTPESLSAMNGENITGRSYTYKDKFSKLSATSLYYGYNFMEQWERAYELNPEFIFVTGWNEWNAVHFESWRNVKGAFPDLYNDEYSRDIEPTNGEFKDTYYYLLVNGIRKFKGVRPTPIASAEKTIDISAGFEQWSDVGPEFVGYKGGTEDRNSILKGPDGGDSVTNTTGRNDIVLSKVARDGENLYFYVETAENLSNYTDPSWMQLFINTDRSWKTGWEGYDYVINRVGPSSETAVIEKWDGKDNMVDWKWSHAGNVSYKVQGNKLMISVPRGLIGVNGVVDIEFKWNDNMRVKGDIMDFYRNGDTAPAGRFAYHYTEVGDKTVTDEAVDPENLLTHKIKTFIVMGIDRNYAYKFGNKIKIDDASDVTAPMIINNKTMVPVRFLAESIGAEVSWNDETKTVMVQKEGKKRISLKLDSNVMKVEKEQVTLQSPATEVENRIYVPLRDIVEALDITCNWFDPGIIILGVPDNEYTMLFINGGIEQIFNAFEMQR